MQNLKPLLDKLPDVHVTFFLTSMGDGFRTSGDGFAALANSGHEMGNHTESHGHLTSISDNSELEKEIIQFAENIEKTLAENGANIRVISFATPFCENNDNIKSIIAKHHFINRDCGWHGRNEWDVEPDWLSLRAKIWTRSGATVDEMLSSLDTAAFIGNFEGANPWDVQVKGGSWLVVLNHGVTDDQKSVSENAIVEQGGKAIKRESDGSYVIEFTEKSLKVRKPKPGETPDSVTSHSGVSETACKSSKLHKVHAF